MSCLFCCLPPHILSPFPLPAHLCDFSPLDSAEVLSAQQLSADVLMYALWLKEINLYVQNLSSTISHFFLS